MTGDRFEYDCADYVALLDSPNANGQCIHAQYGESNLMLRVLYERHGKERVNAELDRLFDEEMAADRKPLACDDFEW